MTAGDQLITLVNGEPREVVVRVERAGDRAFALTAARVMANSAFRALFPDQALAPGRLMAITQATLVVVQLDDAQTLFRELGDTKAFPVAARFFEIVGALASEYGGSLIKTFGGLAIAAFERPTAAVEVALAPAVRGRQAPGHVGPRVPDRGAPRAADGAHAERAARLLRPERRGRARDRRATTPADVSLTAAVCNDVAVAERLQHTPDAWECIRFPRGAGSSISSRRAPRHGRCLRQVRLWWLDRIVPRGEARTHSPAQLRRLRMSCRRERRRSFRMLGQEGLYRHLATSGKGVWSLSTRHWL